MIQHVILVIKLAKCSLQPYKACPLGGALHVYTNFKRLFKILFKIFS